MSCNQLLDYLSMNYRPVPTLSLSYEHCMEVGKDYSQPGGAQYNAGGGVITVGQADIINSIADVKYLVFDEKKISMDTLIKALDANFEGYEDIQKLCLEAPKYGNDDPRADFCVGEIFNHVADQFENTIRFWQDDLGYVACIRQYADWPVGRGPAERTQGNDTAHGWHRCYGRYGRQWPDGPFKISQPPAACAFYPGHAAQYEVRTGSHQG